MANPNNNNWMSMLVGQDIEPPLPQTVEEIPCLLYTSPSPRD